MFAHNETKHFYSEAIRLTDVSTEAEVRLHPVIPENSFTRTPRLMKVHEIDDEQPLTRREGTAHRPACQWGRGSGAPLGAPEHWRRARWHYEVGRAEWSLGRMQETLAQLRRALELLASPQVAGTGEREQSIAGFLRTQEGPRHIWKRRWFLLDDNVLYVFKDLPEFKPSVTVDMNDVQLLEQVRR